MKKLLLSVIDAAEVLGIGKNKMYEIVHAGHLGVLKIGGTKIPYHELERFTRECMNKDFDDANNVKEFNIKEWRGRP